MSEIYNFSAKTRKGEDRALADFKGKVLLIINMATGCGFTPHGLPLKKMVKLNGTLRSF